MYSFDSVIRYSETGEDEKLSMYGLVNYFQDCSTFQSMHLNVGVDELAMQHRCWLLTYWKIVVNSYPKLGDRVCVKTWAYGFEKFIGKRNFLMVDSEGEVLAAADSVWVHLDTDTLRPVFPEERATAVYGLESRFAGLEYENRKIKLMGDFVPRASRVVETGDIDTNHHMNNAQYVRMAREYIPLEMTPKMLRVEYKKPAICGDVLVPMVNVDDKSQMKKEAGISGAEDFRCQVILADQSGNAYAVTEWQ